MKITKTELNPISQNMDPEPKGVSPYNIVKSYIHR